MSVERAEPIVAERAFMGRLRWHAENPSEPGFSFCGVWRAGATPVSAVEAPKYERCEGLCRYHWPAPSGTDVSGEQPTPESVQVGPET